MKNIIVKIIEQNEKLFAMRKINKPIKYKLNLMKWNFTKFHTKKSFLFIQFFIVFISLFSSRNNYCFSIDKIIFKILFFDNRVLKSL